MKLLSFSLMTCFLGFCTGDAFFTLQSPVTVTEGDRVNLSCVTDSPWIWMDLLKNKTWKFPILDWTRTVDADGSETFSQEVIGFRNVTRRTIHSNFVRYDEIVNRNPRITVSFTTVPMSNSGHSKTMWNMQITNASRSDEGDYSCLEQIFYPSFTSLTRNSTAFVTLRVL